jgi:hypothetical protein
MRNIVFGTLLFAALASIGCKSSPLHETLLLQENRRLEDALYVAHAQAAELRRENSLLQNRQSESSSRSYTGSQEIEWDSFPTLEVPKVLLPEQPGTPEVPGFLRGSETMPTWGPRR